MASLLHRTAIENVKRFASMIWDCHYAPLICLRLGVYQLMLLPSTLVVQVEQWVRCVCVSVCELNDLDLFGMDREFNTWTFKIQ